VKDHVGNQVVELPYVDALAELHLDVASAVHISNSEFQSRVPAFSEDHLSIRE